jgi:hypothetical protein
MISPSFMLTTDLNSFYNERLYLHLAGKAKKNTLKTFNYAKNDNRMGSLIIKVAVSQKKVKKEILLYNPDLN